MTLRQALDVRLDVLGARPAQPVEVAVLDSGIDATHPDLKGRVTAAYRVETDAPEPVVQEVPPGANDDYGHGTGVASIIARLAPHARLVDVRVLDARNRGSGPALLAGLECVVSRGCRIVNMSLASKSRWAQPLHDLCEVAYRRNMLVVAAKRNMPLLDNGFPAELSSVIGVDREAFESPFMVRYQADHAIEYLAQGDNVPVAAAGGGYTRMTGTSFATPTVSGLVALLVGVFPELRPFEVKALLKAHAVL